MKLQVLFKKSPHHLLGREVIRDHWNISQVFIPLQWKESV